LRNKTTCYSGYISSASFDLADELAIKHNLTADEAFFASALIELHKLHKSNEIKRSSFRGITDDSVMKATSAVATHIGTKIIVSKHNKAIHDSADTYIYKDAGESGHTYFTFGVECYKNRKNFNIICIL